MDNQKTEPELLELHPKIKASLPWQYQKNADAYTHIIRGLENQYIGSTPQLTDGSAEATAKLWAAAPELFEALQILLWDFRSLIKDSNGQPAVIIAKDALKKAVGENPYITKKEGEIQS